MRIRRLVPSVGVAIGLALAAGAHAQDHGPDRGLGPHAPTVHAPGPIAGAPVGVPPFGGGLVSRLDRLGADIETGTKEGWLRTGEARRLANQVKTLRSQARAIESARKGPARDAREKALQTRIQAVFDRLSNLHSRGRR